jgi:eukaryotic-like serine/threonine-protein kinase
MGAAAIPEQAVCRRCGARMSPNDSYSGYCFSCLLGPALDSGERSQVEQDGHFAHYEIQTHPDGCFVELGRGAMGVTYRATDTTLRFPVALKIIDPRVAGLEVNRERFLREARAAARLRHPHVASVLYYGVGPHGQCFYTMEFVEGETLAARVQRSGPLPVSEALEVIAQVASALEAAEQPGLVHRDLKPANLMLVKGKGINVKVIDFGLAKVAGGDETTDSITQGGFLGTPAFASPEQFCGAEVDRRSDYFSLGSTLFYLVTGAAPFKADGANQLGEQIAKGTVPIDRLQASAVPRPVRELVISLLSADPAKRPQTGQALVEAIAKCQRAIGAPKTPEARRNKLVKLAVGIGLLLIAAAAIYIFKSQPADLSAKSIAVLPFDNFSPTVDDTYFADGVQDEILSKLAKVSQLKVISRISVMAYRSSTKRDVRSIAAALGVAYLVEGTVQRDGNRVRVSTELIDARTDQTLWSESYQRDLTDIFAIQSEIAQSVAAKLSAQLSPEEQKSIEQRPTKNLEAYDLYLQAKDLIFYRFGQEMYQTSEEAKAIKLLEEATRKDPQFTLAYCLIAKVHDDLYHWWIDRTPERRALADAAVQEALRLEPDSPEAHLAEAYHLWACDRNYERANVQIELAQRDLPNSSEAFSLDAKIDVRLGRWEDAIKAKEKAHSLDPRNLEIDYDLSWLYGTLRRYREVEQLGVKDRSFMEWLRTGDSAAYLAKEQRRLPLDNPWGRSARFWLTVLARDWKTASQILANNPNQDLYEGDIALVPIPSGCGEIFLAALQGKHPTMDGSFRTAREELAQRVEAHPDEVRLLSVLGLVDAVLGRKKEALEEADRAVELRPLSEDAGEGREILTERVKVYIWTDGPDLAFRELARLIKIPPLPPSRALFAADPFLDPIRKDPRFDNLLAQIPAYP